MTEQTEDSATENSATDNSATDKTAKRETATQSSATDDRATDDRATDDRATDDGATDDGASDDSPPEAGEIAAEVEFMAAERLIFFTDAVAAIAMTLLAFDLRAPDIARMSNGGALAALWAEPYRLGYLTFLISFVVIGSHWRAHHRLFRHVSKLDSRLISLNMLWLLMIVIMPFATRVLSGTGAFGIRFSLYAIIQVITMLTALLMSRHIRANDLLRPGAPQPVPTDYDATLLTGAAMFAISIPVAFVSPWAFAIWVASAPAARLVRRLRRRD
jgi:uncharacterized membrane protein